MHPDLASLLRYAKQFPDDDTARLVLADWLEENGDIDGRARAEFIRLQLLGEEHWASAETLRLRHLHYWLGAFVDVPGVVGGEFRRGLLRLKIESPFAFDSLRMPQIPDWNWVDGLICSHGDWDPTGEAVLWLVTSPSLTGLSYLSLQGANSRNAAIIRLAKNPAIAALRVLDLSECSVDESAAQALVRSPHLPNLREILLIDASVRIEAENILRERWGDGVCRPL